MTDIYPKKFKLVPDTNDVLTSPFLDALIIIDRKVISTKNYEKTSDANLRYEKIANQNFKKITNL